MKSFLCILALLLCSSVVFGQNEPNKKADKITDKQIAELPKFKGSKPKLEMQAAMKLMEEYIQKQKINTANYYLTSARMIAYGADGKKQPAWHFSWTNINFALGDYIEIIVFMDRGVLQIPSM